MAEAASEVLRDDGDKLLAHNGYLPGGLPALREALAGRTTDLGAPTSPDQVMITTGAQQAVNLAAQMLVGRGDEVVIESPSFNGTLDVIRTQGARLSVVPVDDDGVDVRGVARAMAERNPVMVYLLPSWQWRRPKGGPSLWVELPAGSASAFTQVALRFGVEVIPGDQMSPTGDDRRYLRLPYTAEPPVLEETMRRLAQAWEAYSSSDDSRSTARPVMV